jgi:sporulation-control protein
MKKLLSSIGVGSASVDTILADDEVQPGEQVDLTVEIEGGTSQQEIEGIYFLLETKCRSDEGGYETETIEETKAVESFTIDPGERRELPATMTLPRVTPEVICAPLSDELEVHVEVDRRESTYTDVTGGDESAEWITVDHADTDLLQDEMRALITQALLRRREGPVRRRLPVRHDQ